MMKLAAGIGLAIGCLLGGDGLAGELPAPYDTELGRKYRAELMLVEVPAGPRSYARGHQPSDRGSEGLNHAGLFPLSRRVLSTPPRSAIRPTGLGLASGITRPNSATPVARRQTITYSPLKCDGAIRRIRWLVAARGRIAVVPARLLEIV